MTYVINYFSKVSAILLLLKTYVYVPVSPQSYKPSYYNLKKIDNRYKMMPQIYEYFFLYENDLFFSMCLFANCIFLFKLFRLFLYHLSSTGLESANIPWVKINDAY